MIYVNHNLASQSLTASRRLPVLLRVIGGSRRSPILVLYVMDLRQASRRRFGQRWTLDPGLGYRTGRGAARDGHL